MDEDETIIPSPPLFSIDTFLNRGPPFNILTAHSFASLIVIPSTTVRSSIEVSSIFNTITELSEVSLESPRFPLRIVWFCEIFRSDIVGSPVVGNPPKTLTPDFNEK